MTTQRWILIAFLTLLTLLIGGVAGAGCVGGTGDGFRATPDDSQVSADDENGGTYIPLVPGDKADGFTASSAPLVFDRACEPGKTITIGAVGDVLLHGSLQRQAYDDPKTFNGLWDSIAPLLAQPDVMYANLEGPSAQGIDTRGKEVDDPGMVYGVNNVYTSYPQFNYHPQLITDLVSTGFDVVSTSNNHALDHRTLGVDRTIDALEERGLAYTGTRRSDNPQGSFHTATYVDDIKIAWLGCSFSTNGIPDQEQQVLHCFSQRDELLSTISKLAARPDIHGVIVTPHWGTEYNGNPNRDQIELAHDMLEAGALAVIGSHPHVLQPWERYITQDGREGFVIYSLGNFVSNQSGTAKRSTLLLYLGLTVTSDGEHKQVHINGVRYVPLYMLRTSPMGIGAIDPLSGNFRDSLDHTTSIFGSYNLMRSTSSLVTNPQCDPTWAPQRTTPTFIGDACSSQSDCAFDEHAFCHESGFCTVSCEGTCADRQGYATTFCAEVGSEGLCVPKSMESYDYCAHVPGTQSRPANRFLGNSDATPTVATVCVPED